MTKKQKPIILWFDEITKEDVSLVGGKGANLGEMTNAGFPIPFGFVITSFSYFEFIKSAGLEKRINELLAVVNYENPSELHQVSTHIRELILKSESPSYIDKKIINYYENLISKEAHYLEKKLHWSRLFLHKIQNIFKYPLVAVRSSATAEDLPTASFAGQQETFLNVKGENNLLLAVKKCWASLFTERAIYYRHQMNFSHDQVGLAVVVQRMVQSTKSGIAFSVDPISNEKNRIIIEAIYGLGELIVGGKVDPDHYEVDKKSLVILKKEIKKQNFKMVKSGKKNVIVKLGKKEALKQKITDEEIIKLALLVKDIEKHYFFPQDIEWAIEKNKVFIVQSRPITTINKDNQPPKEKEINWHQLPILIGLPASPGVAIGPVKIVHSPQEISRILPGDILVAPQTNPDFVPAMRKAAAIITEHGGRTSHAAIVSRELGIPAIVGVDNALSLLKEGEIITVNGLTGEIYRGKVVVNQSATQFKSDQKKQKLNTITKVYVNLAQLDEVKKIASHDVDGVGLLRAEFMIAQLGIHPKEFIRKKKEHLFINHLTRNLSKFAQAFAPRPVVYRATDFKTNEYSHLLGGKKYEPSEENPMLGFRGASRFISQPDVFLMEIQALKKVWQLGYRNLHLMIPFVRTPWELIKIHELVEQSGLKNYPQFKLWIMVEVPSCALSLEQFIKVGIDGVSIGTNDLTMMLLGVDRDNEKVSMYYDERNPLVLAVIKDVIKTCKKYGITCSLCGQAASDYPEVVEVLVKEGITSVSVNPDALERTRELIYNIEKNFFK